jgi:hypothetical protein
VARANVSSIGFTKTSAEEFFKRLLDAGVRSVMDVRLHNTSQLAGFAKANDLAFFLRRIETSSMCTSHCSLQPTRCSRLIRKKKVTGARRRSASLGLCRNARSRIVLHQRCSTVRASFVRRQRRITAIDALFVSTSTKNGLASWKCVTSSQAC